MQNARGSQTKLAFPAIVVKVEEEDEVAEYAALPESLNTLVSLHEACLKAMTLHFAHNGTSAPANLSNFLESVTRLWKKRQVQKQDIRKMMALIELDASSVLSKMGEGQTVKRSKGYFKLFQSGLGIQHLLIEYIGGTSLKERKLHQEYSSHIHDIWQQAQNNVQLITNLSNPSKLPEITIEVGAQQAARHEKAKNLRTSILSQHPQTTPPAKSHESQPANASRRKETLLDRILAKQRAALSTPQPTTQELALHRAKGRVSELADILNIIQKQRTRNQAISRISFSFGQLVSNIKDSVRVPISEEEISFGLEVLARENVAGSWISMTEMGEKAVRPGGNGWEGRFVVLNGRGFSGGEIQERVSGL